MFSSFPPRSCAEIPASIFIHKEVEAMNQEVQDQLNDVAGLTRLQMLRTSKASDVNSQSWKETGTRTRAGQQETLKVVDLSLTKFSSVHPPAQVATRTNIGERVPRDQATHIHPNVCHWHVVLSWPKHPLKKIRHIRKISTQYMFRIFRCPGHSNRIKTL